MRSSLRFAIAAVTAVSVLAPVSAKIFPDDFIGPIEQQDMMLNMPEQTDPESIPLEITPSAPETWGVPMFGTSDKLTRGEFIAALTHSMYTWEQHQRCFAEIAGGSTDYELLFSDVHVNSMYAPEVCMAMRNGWIDGYKDSTFRPNMPIMTADGAAILTRAFGLPLSTVKKNQAWYVPYMDAVVFADKRFALKAWDTFTGVQLFHTLCEIENSMPEAINLTCDNQ